ncbi:MAG: PAS domain-containing sensor histidine kinase [bacterium]
MKRIRTKLILSLLLITLLPVLPVYYVIKNLLQQSIEVGYNQNVERALESAYGISSDLYAKHKEETLALAAELAALESTQKVITRGSAIPAGVVSRINSLGSAKVDVFDLTGRLLRSATTDSPHNSGQEQGLTSGATAGAGNFKSLYQNVIQPLANKNDPAILESASGPGVIVAFAPVHGPKRRIGSLVVTRKIDEAFTKKRELVVKVLQMFKTLSFFEGDLTRGFLLVFFAVYTPLAALSIALGIYFSRKVTSPLLTLARGTQKVAAGDWDYRVEVQTKDEIGVLGEAFNRMVVALKEKQDQVIALEKMAVWREIARVLAHEIKNPLTPIQLTVQQLKDRYGGEDPEYEKLLAECTEIITDEIESLRALVREFSEFARMPKLNLTPGNLNELVEEVRKIYPNDNIELELDSTLPETRFDHEKMRRALINLIENGMDSIKEKGQGGILLQTRKENGSIRLDYSDTGTGIPPDLQAKVFEPYFSTKKSGMGLGLAIVKRIVIEHGGDISLASKKGQGTQFQISLPILDMQR